MQAYLSGSQEENAVLGEGFADGSLSCQKASEGHRCSAWKHAKSRATKIITCFLFTDRFKRVKTTNMHVLRTLRTLNIVVEGTVFFPILPKEAECVVIPKVLKLNQRPLSIFVHNSFHELINQIIVGLRAIPFLIETHVEGIFQKSLVRAQTRERRSNLRIIKKKKKEVHN